MHDEPESHDRWLVSYADFITLLFAFFTVMYATSQQDAAKGKEFEKSIRQSFALMGQGGAGGGAGAPSKDLKASLPSAELKAESRSGGGLEAFPGLRAGPAEVQDYIERRLQQDMGKSDDGQAVKAVQHDAVGVRIQLAAATLFPEGSADLRPDAMGTLGKIGRLLKDSDRRLIIEGHTDNEPIRTARFPTNWELSALRATKIVRYLNKRQGIEENKMTAVAYADQKPTVANDTAQNRARNRRIEILIVTGDASRADRAPSGK